MLRYPLENFLNVPSYVLYFVDRMYRLIFSCFVSVEPLDEDGLLLLPDLGVNAFLLDWP